MAYLTDEEYKLKSCPFCGHKAVFNIRSIMTADFVRGFSFNIECSNCKISKGNIYTFEFSFENNGRLYANKDERQDAVDEWNKRVIDSVGGQES